MTTTELGRKTTALALRYRSVARCAPGSRAAAAAMDRLWAACEGIFWTVARDVYRPNRSCEPGDLVNAAFPGLPGIARTFDPARGSFSVYLNRSLRRDMRQDFDAFCRLVAVPRGIADEADRAALGRPPRRYTDPAKVAAALRLRDAPVFPVRPEHRVTEPAADAVELAEAVAMLPGLLARLEPRQSLAVRLRFGLDGHAPRTLAEVGLAMGLDRHVAKYHAATALDRLRALVA